MRIGFAIGNSGLIDALNRVKNSFNSYTLDRLAIIAGTEAFRDNEYFLKTKGLIERTRERISRQMREIGFIVADSVANFIFVRHQTVDAFVIFNELRQRGILVRYFNKPRIENHLRVSIGSDAEMDCLLAALREIVGTAGLTG
jgi:histidinol-phosphate aminotransferase